MPQQEISRKKKGREGQMAVPIVEFTAAAHEHVEPAFDQTVTPGAAVQNLGPFDVPAYGFVRHIYLLVTTSGGVAGPGVLSGDAPFNLFSEVTFLDVNGAPIFGPYTGYQTFLANLFGGYAFAQDPRLAPDNATATTNVVDFTYGIRIPIEINHNNALGALANQNAAASYKVRLVINPSTTIWSTAPTTIPAVRIQGFLEAWSQPSPTDLAGRPQAMVPPRHGTTQYWSLFEKDTVAGSNTILHPRVGNLIRNLIYVVRDGSGVRTTANFPDPNELRWDARQLIREPRQLRRQYAAERNLFSTAGMPAGPAFVSKRHKA